MISLADQIEYINDLYREHNYNITNHENPKERRRAEIHADHCQAVLETLRGLAEVAAKDKPE